MMKEALALITYLGAAFFEIAGCFAFWAWLKQGHSAWWGLPGVVSLGLFACLLTRIDSASAGRAYAAYGGVYILAALIWMQCIEGQRPDRWDLVGALVSVAGAATILWGPRNG